MTLGAINLSNNHLQAHNDERAAIDGETVYRIREAPLPASRYGALGADGTVDETTQLQAWLDALATVPNSQGRFDGRRYKTTATLVVPGVRGLSLTGLGIIGQDSGTIKDGSGTLILPPANTPALQFKANISGGSSTPYNQKFSEFGVYYAAASGTGNTRQIAFLFEDNSVTGPSWFGTTFERIVIHNCFQGWFTAGAAGKSPNLWNMHWRDINAYGTQRNVWALTPTVAVGQPISTWRDIGVFNTNTSVVADGPIWALTAGEVHMSGLDLEGWNNNIFILSGGWNATIDGMHVEHHTIDATTSTSYILFFMSSGKLKIENASFSGTSAGGAFGVTAIASAQTADASVELDGVTMSWTSVTGSLSMVYGATGAYKVGHVVTGAGAVAPSIPSVDAATALKTTGFDDRTSSVRLGSSREYFGNGVPASGLGANGDWYKRLDGGGAGATHLYFKNAGAWLGIA